MEKNVVIVFYALFFSHLVELKSSYKQYTKLYILLCSLYILVLSAYNGLQSVSI